MRKCEICDSVIRVSVREHERSLEHEKSLEKAFIHKFVEKHIDVERLKGTFNERIGEHVKNFLNFAIMFCWKVNNIENSISIVKEEVPGSGSNHESSDNIMNRVFNQINIDKLEEFTLMFVSDIKKLAYRYYMNQPMEMIQRKLLRRFIEGKDVIYKYKLSVGCQIMYYILN